MQICEEKSRLDYVRIIEEAFHNSIDINENIAQITQKIEITLPLFHF